MYLPTYHRMADPETAYALLRSSPLGAWVCQTPEGLVANSIPFVLDRSRSPLGTLIGHVSRANPVWRELRGSAPSVVMFQGPQAYITPGWYPGKAAHGKVVPTWNYVAAHAHGVARAVDDPAWLRDMLERLTAQQEAGQHSPWQPADAPPEFIDRLLRAIVGIEIPIDRLEGKSKLGQDEDLPDCLGAAFGLQQSGCTGDQELAQRMLQAAAEAAPRGG